MDAVGNQTLGFTEQADADLSHCQAQVDRHAGPGAAGGGARAFGGAVLGIVVLGVQVVGVHDFYTYEKANG